MIRSVNQATIDLIKNFEGFREVPYKDGAGLLTVGIGHKILPTDKLTYPLSEVDAETLLQSDLATKACNYVMQYVAVDLNDNQYGALCSFCFNEGCGKLLGSTLLKKINAGDPDADEEFPKWIYVNGAVEYGLVKRRAAERALFLSNDGI